MHRGRQLLAAESFGPQPFVNVEVEQPVFRLGDPTDGVGVHPDQLQQCVLGYSGRERQCHPPLRLEVLVERLVLVPQAGGDPQATHRVGFQAGLLGDPLDGVSRPG